MVIWMVLLLLKVFASAIYCYAYDIPKKDHLALTMAYMGWVAVLTQVAFPAVGLLAEEVPFGIIAPGKGRTDVQHEYIKLYVETFPPKPRKEEEGEPVTWELVEDRKDK